jgi:hypothetical protein
VGNTGHLSKLLRYFSSKSGLPPEAAVPWKAVYDRNAANTDIHLPKEWAAIAALKEQIH